MKEKKKKTEGITLIALIITIIVLLILSTVAIKIISGEGMIGHAIEAKLRTELSSYQEALKIFKADKGAANNGFYEESLTAGQNSLFYNTKPENENGDIKTVIPNLANAYLNTLEIIKGELLLTTQDKHLIKVAKELGIEVNPYIIIDGELMSNDGNLLLVDENGVLTVPETVTKIGEGAFSNVEGLKKIIIPGTVKEIAANAFKDNITLEEVVMQEGVETIGASAFSGCVKLKKIGFPESLATLGEYAMFGCVRLEIIDLSSTDVKNILQGTFQGCTRIHRMVFPEKLQKIGYNSLAACTSIERVIIPAAVSFIDSGALTSCTKLTNIDTDNNSTYTYQNGVLMKRDGSNVVFISAAVLKSSSKFEIPEGLTSFDVTISSYTNITELVIPKSLTSIAKAYIFPSTIENVEVQEGNNSFYVENSALYTSDKKTLVYCFSKSKEIQLIPEVETIDAYSFRGAINAEVISLSDAIKAINNQALASNTKLTRLYIGKNVSSINPLFKYKNYSGEIIIDDQNPHYMVKENVIYSKDQKTIYTVANKINGKFTLNNMVERIGNEAFRGQVAMSGIELNTVLKNIGNQALAETNVSNIEIPNNIEEISSIAFAGATKLKEIIIHKEENAISGAPWGCQYGLRAIKWQP